MHIFRSIIVFIAFQVVFIVVDIIGWEPNRNRLYELVVGFPPIRFFEETFAPYKMLEFNIMTAGFLIALLASIISQLWSRSSKATHNK
ncbi:YfzA family protein [Shouchella clausii]|uniref:YfzA family protein n=1 Tax=Shouchella clausii TaxID=79880 RepID=UPI000BA4EA65|nr:YfzA family protein [Shouchella clausii]PAE95930.1 hypothetical protein CHH70_03115 [Shouchella clausii]